MINITIIMLSLQKKCMETIWYGWTDAAIVADMGQRLRLVRLNKSITQQTLAEQTGLNRTTIRDIERGKPVNIMSLLPVLRALDLLENLDAVLPHPLRQPALGSRQVARQRVRAPKKA